MFYYFGAKHANASKYQPPHHDLIVEPFAGAAGYACYWLEKGAAQRAVLIEADQRVVETWNRILAQTPEQIMAWTTPTEGERTNDLCVIGSGGGGTLSNDTPNKVSSRQAANFPAIRRRIARMRATIGDRIEITHGDYRDAPDIEATWFIDPPYQHQGHWYRHSSNAINYASLSTWVRSRRGQVIACESAPADWLPFRPLYSLNSLAGTDGTELVWESHPDPTLFGHSL